jgi:hypothetical protein
MQERDRLVFQDGLHPFRSCECPNPLWRRFHRKAPQGVNPIGQTPASEAGQQLVDIRHDTLGGGPQPCNGLLALRSSGAPGEFGIPIGDIEKEYSLDQAAGSQVYKAFFQPRTDFGFIHNIYPIAFKASTG